LRAVAGLPQSYRRVLRDGAARAGAFRSRFSVTGIERDADAVVRARELAGGPNFIQADVRDYRPDLCAYDLAIIMSQSFGYFDAATNRDLLRRLANGVRPGGRVIIDLWSPQFFVTHQGERDLGLPDGIVRERKSVEGGRLFVHLDYPDGSADDFEWQLFTPSEMSSLADSVDLALIASCTDYDMAVEPCPAQPRIQFVLEREV
jgi:SAM-dependent methyltransferase